MRRNTIAIVEDSEDNALLVKYLLKPHFNTLLFINGLEFLEKFDNAPIDLILMDISMPIMDGIETLKHIREDKKSNMPIIALTAHAMKEDEEKFLKLGFDDYISKPVSEDILLNKIRRLLPRGE